MTQPGPPPPPPPPPPLEVKKRQARSQNSDIRGIGYGDWHAWDNVDTARVGSAAPEYKWTRYDCRVCGASFKHYYDMQPNIFDAMKAVPVPDQCHPKTKSADNAQRE